MPISISQVWNTTLDVMKEASISPAQGLYNYWHFRKITFNYEIFITYLIFIVVKEGGLNKVPLYVSKVK